MNDINFVDTDTNDIKANVITVYEALSGRSLAMADPVRLFLESMADIIVQQRVLINYSAKMNLLAYATGDFLDHIGFLIGTKRIGAAAAVTTLKIRLSAARPNAVIIPAGTRVASPDNIYFATDEPVTITAGETEAVVGATATTVGTAGNGYAPGEITKIVDPIAYVVTMENITETDGGADIEADEPYRGRIQQAPERFSVAGPAGAYEYYAKSASALIVDVAVISPSPGTVNVYPLTVGGELPTTEIIQLVTDALSDDVRPLTDHVEVLSPTEHSYDVNLTYYIDNKDATKAAAIQSAVDEAVADYTLWQRSAIGRDINPTELIYRVRAAGAKRVEVVSPLFEVVDETEVAIATTATAIYGGLEHG